MILYHCPLFCTLCVHLLHGNHFQYSFRLCNTKLIQITFRSFKVNSNIGEIRIVFVLFENVYDIFESLTHTHKIIRVRLFAFYKCKAWVCGDSLIILGRSMKCKIDECRNSFISSCISFYEKVTSKIEWEGKRAKQSKAKQNEMKFMRNESKRKERTPSSDLLAYR